MPIQIAAAGSVSVLVICADASRRQELVCIASELTDDVSAIPVVTMGQTGLLDSKPGLIVVEVDDTSEDGFTLVKRICSLSGSDQLAVLVLTSNLEDQAYKALDAGADDCLLRQSSPMLIKRRMKALLRTIQFPDSDANVIDPVSVDEAIYRKIFDRVNTPIFIVSLLTGKFLDANSQALDWLGYTKDELRAIVYDDIADKPATTFSMSAVQKMSNTGQFMFQQTFRTKAGRSVTAEISGRIFTYRGERASLNVAHDTQRSRIPEHIEQSQRRIVDALRESASVLTSRLDIREIADQVLDYVRQVVPGNAASLMLRDQADPEIAYIVAYQGYDPGEFNHVEHWDEIPWRIQSTPTLIWMVENGKPLVIPDVRQFEGWVVTGSPIRSYVGAPILVENEVIGFINIQDRQTGLYIDAHAEQLMAFANQAGIAITNARLHESVRRYAVELEDRVDQRTAELSEANAQLKEQIRSRQKIQAELLEERNLLRHLIDNIPDEIHVKDLDGRFILANRAYFNRASLLIAPGKQVIGSTAFDYINPEFSIEDAKAVILQERQVIETGKQLDYAISVNDGYGRRQWKQMTKVRLADVDNNPIGVIIIGHDITEQREAQDRLEHIISGAHCLLWYAIVTKDGERYNWHVEISNEAAAQAFVPLNVPPTSNYIDTFFSNMDRDDFYQLRSVTELALEKRQTNVKSEFRVTRSDGNIRWLQQDIQIRPLTPGRFNLVGVCTDVTDSHEVEIALQRTNELLEQRVAERTARLSQANQQLVEQINERERAETAEWVQRILAEALMQSAIALGETLDLDEVVERTLTYAARVLPPHKAASIMLISHDSELMVTTLSHRTFINGKYVFQEGIGATRLDDMPVLRAIYDHGPLVIPDVDQHADWVKTEYSDWVRSYIGVPIHAEGKVMGFFNLDSGLLNQFSEEHITPLVAFANQAGIAIRNAQLFAEVQSYTTELQERIDERTQELEHERSQLDALLNAMSDGVVYYQAGTLIFFNRALVDLTGYEGADWEQPDILARLIDMPSDDYQKLLEEMNRHLDSTGIHITQTRIIRKNGSVFDAKVITTNVTDTNEKPIGRVSVIRDVSIEKRLEIQKSRFIANASHELRTPITNLKTRLYLIDHQPDKVGAHLAVMREVTDRMRTLVDTLLDVSRFEHGIIKLALAPKVLQPIIADIARVQRPEAALKKLELVEDLPVEPVWAKIDEARIIQVITNLITNAINYTPQGCVRVELKQNETCALLSVIDTGIGISEELIEEIFKPFVRSNDQVAGVGLGLSITKEIVELHGGTIRVESAVGKGTCFFVELPLLSTD